MMLGDSQRVFHSHSYNSMHLQTLVRTCTVYYMCNVMNLEPAGCKNNFVVDGRSKLQTIGVELGVIKGTPYFCHLPLLVHACTCIYGDPHLRKI